MLVTFGAERVNVLFDGILLSLACLSSNVRMIELIEFSEVVIKSGLESVYLCALLKHYWHETGQAVIKVCVLIRTN